MNTTNALEVEIKQLESERTDILGQRQIVVSDDARIRKQRVTSDRICRCGDKPRDVPHGSWCPQAELDTQAAANTAAIEKMDDRLRLLKAEIHRLREALDIDFTKALRTVLREQLSEEAYRRLIEEANSRVDTMRIERLAKP